MPIVSWKVRDRIAYSWKQFFSFQLICHLWKKNSANGQFTIAFLLLSLLLYLVIKPILPIQSAKVIHGENMAFVIDPKCFGHSWSRRTLEGLY